MAGIAHRHPRLSGRQRIALLQQFHRDIIGRAHKGHMAIPRGPVDHNAILLQILAHVINIIHQLRQMAKMSAVAWQSFIAIPIISQLDRAIFLALGRHED